MKTKISMIIGGIFLIIAMAVCVNSIKFIKTATSSQGKVISLSKSCGSESCTYAPEVSFIAQDGKEYKFFGVRTNPPAKQVGQDVKLLYDPNNPQAARINDFLNFWLLPFILFVFGGIFISIGYFLDRAFNRKISKDLQQNGQRIEATVQQVGLDGIKINGRSPYRVVAQWVSPGSNKAYIFKSSYIWLDPQAYVKPGDRIKVTIDPNNPKKYFVDISFLPVVENG